MEHLIMEQQFSCVVAWISSSFKFYFPFSTLESIQEKRGKEDYGHGTSDHGTTIQLRHRLD
jgi:hypothetical protein